MKNSNKIIYGVCNGSVSKPEIWGWEYCVEHKIPFICVTHKTKYSHVSIDLETVDEGLTFDDPNHISKLWQKFYFNYCDLTELPGNKRGFIGSYSNFGVKIFKKDYHTFSTEFYNYAQEVLSKYGKIDMYLRELNMLYVAFNHAYKEDVRNDILNREKIIKAKMSDYDSGKIPANEERRMYDYNEVVVPDPLERT